MVRSPGAMEWMIFVRLILGINNKILNYVNATLLTKQENVNLLSEGFTQK